MGAADKGSTQYGEITSSKRFLLAIYDNESLTSWIIRAALQHFCSPDVLTYYYWREKRLLNLDIDRLDLLKNEQIFNDLAILSGSSIDDLKRRNLCELAALSENLVLPMFKRNRYALHGYYYCPECMGDIYTTHLRLNWRFVWAVGCTTHKVKLRNACPNCGKKHQPQLLNPMTGGIGISYCAFCGTFLSQKGIPIDENALALQILADDVWENYGGMAFGVYVDMPTWFKCFMFCIGIIRKAFNLRSGQKYQNFLLQLGIDIQGIEIFVTSNNKPMLNLLTQEERERLYALVYRMMILPVIQWEEVATTHTIAKTAFGFESLVIPSPLTNFYEMLPKKMPQGKRKITNKGIKSVETVKRSWLFIKQQIKLQEQYEKAKKQNK